MASITFCGGPINSLDSTATTLTAESSTANTESSQLQNRSLAARWMTTQSTSTLEADFGSAVSIGAVAIIHEMSTQGNIRIRADNSTAYSTSSTSYYETGSAVETIWQSTGYVSGKQGIRLFLFNTTSVSDPTARYMLFDFEDAGSSSIVVNRILVSEALEFDGFRYGHTQGMNDLSDVKKNGFGRIFAEDRPKQEWISLVMHDMSKDHAMQQLRQKLSRQLGTHGEMVVSLLPDSTTFDEEETIYARFKTLPTIASLAVPSIRYSAGITLEELL